MGSICIILRKAPYGTLDAAEAVRHGLGGVTEEMEVRLILVDGGVNAARKGQEAMSAGYVNIGEGIGDCIDMGVAVFVDGESAMKAGLETPDLADEVKISNSAEISAIIKDSDTTIIF